MGPSNVSSISSLLAFCPLLAQAEENGGAAPGAGAFSSLFPLLLIGILFYLILLRPERRKQREHTNLLSNLKKNDKVVTIGGIYGKVFDVQREQDRVILKVDEATNTKLEVTFGAIARVISEETAEKEKTTK
jgi:preprotein translocase subunit YajC